MNKVLFRKIQLCSNIAIIVIALLLSAITIKQFFLTAPAQELSTKAPISLPISNNVPQNPTGKNIQLENVDWSKNKKTLVFYISNNCHFCSESAGFYQRIVQESDQNNIKLIAVLPQSVEEGHQYLNKLNIKIDDVRQSSLDTIGVRGTPTLLLVNESGTVINSWIGKLPAEREEQVLSTLKS